jgi:hypothetical protein
MRLTKWAFTLLQFAAKATADRDGLIVTVVIPNLAQESHAVVDGTCSHMRHFAILIILGKVAPHDLEIRMSHEPLQGEDLRTISEHIQSESTSEIV